MKRSHFFLIIFSFIQMPTFAQQSKIDSLLNVLDKSKDDTSKLRALNLLSRQLLKSGDFDTALYYVNQAKAFAENKLILLDTVTSNNSIVATQYRKGLANSYGIAAVIYDQQGNYDLAITYHLIALKIRKAIKDYKSISDSYNNIGIIYWKKGNYPDALICFKEALKLREGIADTNAIASSYTNIGMIYHSQGNYQEALKSYLASLRIHKMVGDSDGIAGCLGNIGQVYFYMGNYAKSIEYHFAALKINEVMEDKQSIALCYQNIGGVYERQGNYSEAMKYSFLSLKIRKHIGDKAGIAASHTSIGIIYWKQAFYEEAIKNYLVTMELSKEINDNRKIAASFANLAMVYFDQKKYNDALKNFLKASEMFEEMGDRQGLCLTYSRIGDVYIAKINPLDAGKYLTKSLEIAKDIRSNDDLRSIYQSLAINDSLKGDFKKAFEHYKLCINYKDSLLNEENTKKIVQSQMQYDFEKKEAATKAETDKKEVLAHAEISKQKVIRNSITAGTGILLISATFSFLFYKRKREATFKNEVSEVEMKALRAQMNPHFIFNSLNSINSYLEKNDNKTASHYLLDFASVMRMILENSEQKEVTLQDDLKALELYMKLEAMRMTKKFAYEIKVDDSIDAENTMIPPLILQPFVENSIWHGLANKEDAGKIIINITKNGDMMECSVEDNGIGREKSGSIKAQYAIPGKKSLGMKITKSRIDILNKIKKSKAGIELIDLAEGLKVVVRLPLELGF